MSKSKEALALLDDLDSFTAPPAPAPAPSTTSAKSRPPKAGSLTAPGAGAPVNDKDAADALAFLDEITQKTSEPRKSVSSMPSTTTRVTLGGASRPNTPGLTGSGLRKSMEAPNQTLKVTESSPPVGSSPAPAGGAGSWGWGSVWNTASAALAQAKERVDEQVKNLPQIPQIPDNEQARKWGEGMMDYVKQAQLDKIAQDLKSTSLSTLTGIMNVVAPPIAEHEVIEVTLSHDMEGYDGVESLVYRALARILEQVEGGDLVVNLGKESRPKDVGQRKGGRNLNPVEGLEAALKLSEAEISEQLKTHAAVPPKGKSSVTAPTTRSTVFLRIQPYTSISPTMTIASTNPNPETPVQPTSSTKHLLQFLLYLSDPSHQLVHTTSSQSVPSAWMTLWDMDGSDSRKNGEWIEDMLVEALRLGVETIGQEYVVARMGWDSALTSSDDGKVVAALDGTMQ